MAIRKIIKIEEDKCNGCGLCVPNCAEGAIQIINGKAVLVKDSYCDGLGACLGHCPQDALHIIEREADEFDEEEAMEFVSLLNGSQVAGKSHHQGHHGHDCKGHHHGEKDHENGHKGHGHGHHHRGGGCPGSRMRVIDHEDENTGKAVSISGGDVEIKIKPQLKQWPVQLSLVPSGAPFFKNADLLITADCVPFALANYHLELLKGKAVVIGCPKLDDIESYVEKLSDIFSENDLKSITVAHMEVPCCSGIVKAAEVALQNSGKRIPMKYVRITIDGQAQEWER